MNRHKKSELAKERAGKGPGRNKTFQEETEANSRTVDMGEKRGQEFSGGQGGVRS